MESGRSDLARAAGEASAADPDPEAAGAGKVKKNRAYSRSLILVSEGPKAAVTETTSAWTGQKKTKSQSTTTSGEHSSGKIVCGLEEREEIDGLDWDDDKLAKEIDSCLRRLKDTPFVYYGGAIDDGSFNFLNDQQLSVLNQRLALYRIRAHEDVDIGEIPGYGRGNTFKFIPS